MHQAGDIAQRLRLVDQGLDRRSRRDVDLGCCHVVTGVGQRLGGFDGALVRHIGQQQVLAGTHAAGDGLADETGTDHDNDVFHLDLL
jgi:hypothetical protein